mmetsp:Transcript_22998/g.61262  ORF Transcript_22998/g.61262 Transcript_22998/m.61262 type:complete len:215 (-) Transcript_22998:314-958(-)
MVDDLVADTATISTRRGYASDKDTTRMRVPGGNVATCSLRRDAPVRTTAPLRPTTSYSAPVSASLALGLNMPESISRPADIASPGISESPPKPLAAATRERAAPPTRPAPAPCPAPCSSDSRASMRSCCFSTSSRSAIFSLTKAATSSSGMSSDGPESVASTCSWHAMRMASSSTFMTSASQAPAKADPRFGTVISSALLAAEVSSQVGCKSIS